MATGVTAKPCSEVGRCRVGIEYRLYVVSREFMLVIIQDLWKHVLILGSAHRGWFIESDGMHVAMILSTTYEFREDQNLHMHINLKKSRELLRVLGLRLMEIVVQSSNHQSVGIGTEICGPV
jgi:hypothetical protein